MIGALLAAALAATPSVRVEAHVADDLATVAIVTDAVVDASGVVHVFFEAERYRAMPEDLLPTAETELYAGAFEPGGFEDVRIEVDGRVCFDGAWPPGGADGTSAAGAQRGPDGEIAIPCAATGRVRVRTTATLVVPDRYGPFSRHHRQLTLGGGWYPHVATPGAPGPLVDLTLVLDAPAGFHVIAGDRWAEGEGVRRKLTLTQRRRQMPLVLLPPNAGRRPLANGRVHFASRLAHRGLPEFERRAEQLDLALTELFDFMTARGWPTPTDDAPLLLVEAPLRHDLARATDGHVLVSDRAFRLTPVERFYRFHRYPILREVLHADVAARLASADPLAVVAADAVAAWRVDALVKHQLEAREEIFDVLSLWSFIPAVDSMLYAPQFPFVGAYFRLIRETDPLRANLLDAPSPHPRGKLLYEKLLDRVGPHETDIAMEAIGQGTDVVAALRVALCDDTDTFLATWLGPYPSVQYRITEYGSSCTNGCTASVTVERTGDAIAEPVELRLIDDDDGERLVRVKTSTAALRTVTATLAAPLSEVILDPNGRLAEAPTAEVPSPKLDNRTHPRWRFLLNNFNILYSPTAGNIDTALDIGFSRVRDVRWRFAARASYAPDAVSLSGRAVYYFGAPLTPDRLSQWIGIVGAGEYLLPNFAGETESAFAASGALFYGWDTRRTAWVAEGGEAIRASIAYDRVIGDLADAPDVTPDAISVSLRGLKAWRFDAAHQLSLRGSLGAFVVGTPRPQLRYALGGRNNVRGYVVDDDVGRLRAIASAEWLHPILWDVDDNVVELLWATKLDGAFFADVAWLGDDLDELGDRPFRADVGYGFRIYLDYFGVRPGVMAVDIAFPLVDDAGRIRVGPPAVYLDFAQSFLSF